MLFPDGYECIEVKLKNPKTGEWVPTKFHRYNHGMLTMGYIDYPAEFCQNRGVFGYEFSLREKRPFKINEVDQALMVAKYFDDIEFGLSTMDPTEALRLLSQLPPEMEVSGPQSLQSLLEKRRDDGTPLRLEDKLIVCSLWRYEHFEILSDPWLAAQVVLSMMTGDSFAVGYFAAKLDTKLYDERIWSAGVKTRQGAALGGQVRSNDNHYAKQAILAEMQRLIARGHSVTNAARVACNNGIGSSMTANRSNWYRANAKKK